MVFPNYFWSFVNNSITHGKIVFNEPIFYGQTQAGYEYLVAVPFEEGLLHVGKSTPIDDLKPLEEMNFEFGDASSERFMGIGMIETNLISTHPRCCFV